MAQCQELCKEEEAGMQEEDSLLNYSGQPTTKSHSTEREKKDGTSQDVTADAAVFKSTEHISPTQVTQSDSDEMSKTTTTEESIASKEKVKKGNKKRSRRRRPKKDTKDTELGKDKSMEDVLPAGYKSKEYLILGHLAYIFSIYLSDPCSADVVSLQNYLLMAEQVNTYFHPSPYRFEDILDKRICKKTITKIDAKIKEVLHVINGLYIPSKILKRNKKQNYEMLAHQEKQLEEFVIVSLKREEVAEVADVAMPVFITAAHLHLIILLEIVNFYGDAVGKTETSKKLMQCAKEYSEHLKTVGKFLWNLIMCCVEKTKLMKQPVPAEYLPAFEPGCNSRDYHSHTIMWKDRVTRVCYISSATCDPNHKVCRKLTRFMKTGAQEAKMKYKLSQMEIFDSILRYPVQAICVWKRLMTPLAPRPVRIMETEL